MKQVFSVLMLMMLCVGTLTLAIKIQPARAAAVIVVPDDYSTIQAAINAANPGDTIYVKNGTYTEYLVIRKDSLTLIGESKDAFINGTLSINADNVTVEGFKIACAQVWIVNGPWLTDELNGPIIELWCCNNTTIMGNTVEGYLVLSFDEAWIGGVGCDLEEGSNNLVRNNVFTSCETSICIVDESNDSVIGNDLNTQDVFQFQLDFSENTTINHNNFYGTLSPVASGGSNATWDDGYPSGGNYWTVYSGTDSFSGPFQNQTGSDGIGDTPYVIDSNNHDNYPLMSPWLRIVGDLNNDGKVSLADLILLAKAYGSKPGDPHWNPLADIAPRYGIISLTDLVTLATHYGQHNS